MWKAREQPRNVNLNCLLLRQGWTTFVCNELIRALELASVSEIYKK
jgi:hypothetical protein